MNTNQQNHLNEIHKRFLKDHADKYIKGAAEHKTTLNKDFDFKQVFQFIKEEVLDLVSYLYTLEELMEQDDES